MPESRGPSLKQLKNEKALMVYAFSLCSLILLIILFRWLRNICNKALHPRLFRGPQNTICRAILLVFRKLETRVKWKWLSQLSYGLLILLGIFLVMNVIICFNILAGYQVNYLASRFGWMAVANMTLCVVFALRNSPLAILTDISHTQLNALHRTIGYWVAFLVLLHGIFYAIHFGRQDKWEKLIEAGNVEGFGAAAAMIILLMGVIRHRNYEIFYVSHVTGFTSAIVLTGLHRPDWMKKLPIAMAFIAGIWILDRIIRAARMWCNLVGSQVTCYPLPGGGTRLFIRGPHAKAALPGSHCFLWLPEITFYQTHPFTIVSNGPSGLELVIKSCEGFTRDLCEFAAQEPDSIHWASIDGPYGSLPDTTAYEKLVLIAGGSGAAFTFGLMNHILDISGGIPAHSIDFVWAVRYTERLSWFREHLFNITASKLAVNVTIYITNEEPTVHLDCVRDSGEMRRIIGDVLPEIDSPETDELQSLLGRPPCQVTEHMATVKYKKMATKTLIRKSMQAIGSHERVLVAACGPGSLLEDLQSSVSRYQSKHSCRIDFHGEEFDS